MSGISLGPGLPTWAAAFYPLPSRRASGSMEAPGRAYARMLPPSGGAGKEWN